MLPRTREECEEEDEEDSVFLTPHDEDEEDKHGEKKDEGEDKQVEAELNFNNTSRETTLHRCGAVSRGLSETHRLSQTVLKFSCSWRQTCGHWLIKCFGELCVRLWRLSSLVLLT